MGTITKRGKGWRAQVRKKGMAPKSDTFPTRAMAQDWVTRIERDYALREARGEPEAADMTLREVIAWYEKEVGATADWGRSKASDLKRLRGYDIAGEKVAAIGTRDYIRHAEMRRKEGAGPATVINDFVWMRQVLKSARPSLGIKVDLSLLDDATHELRQRKIIGKAKSKDRRITQEEEARLLAYFEKKYSDIPMAALMRFALITARRQEEITRLQWKDLDEATSTAWLDDVKHPTRKKGNRKQFRMLREAWPLINAQPRGDGAVFPYNPRTISAYFTKACQWLEIKDLTFHDLRHEATSRLFERGYSIQEVAQFTLHESWATLKRYTHLRPEQVPEK